MANILRSKNIKASMSKKSSPWQNGRQESFYQKLKFELEDFNTYQSQGAVSPFFKQKLPSKLINSDHYIFLTFKLSIVVLHLSYA